MAASDGSVRWFDDWHEFLQSDAAKDIAGVFKRELDEALAPSQERITPEADEAEGTVFAGPTVEFAKYDFDAVKTPMGSILLMVNLPTTEAEALVATWDAYMGGNGRAGELLDQWVGQLADAVENARSIDG